MFFMNDVKKDYKVILILPYMQPAAVRFPGEGASARRRFGRRQC